MCQKPTERKSPQKVPTVFNGISKRFGLPYEGDKIVNPEELKKQIADGLLFGHPDSTEMLAQSNSFGGLE